MEDRIAFYDSLFLADAKREEVSLLKLDRKFYEKTKRKRNIRLV